MKMPGQFGASNCDRTAHRDRNFPCSWYLEILCSGFTREIGWLLTSTASPTVPRFFKLIILPHLSPSTLASSILQNLPVRRLFHPHITSTLFSILCLQVLQSTSFIKSRNHHTIYSAPTRLSNAISRSRHTAYPKIQSTTFISLNPEHYRSSLETQSSDIFSSSISTQTGSQIVISRTKTAPFPHQTSLLTSSTDHQSDDHCCRSRHHSTIISVIILQHRIFT